MSESKGIAGLVTPYNSSEFHAMAEACRSTHHAISDQYVTVAVELRRMLARVGGRQPLNIDARIAARRVARPLQLAAGFELQAARSVVRAHHLFQQYYLGRPGGSHGRTFDVDK